MNIYGFSNLVGQGNFYSGGLEYQQVIRANPDQIAAFTTIDINAVKFEYGSFYENGHHFFGAEWAGTANQKSGVPIGDFRLTRFYFFAGGLASQFLGGHFAITMHQND